jgi:hypothetical protein
MTWVLTRWLWGDGDLAVSETKARKRECERDEELLLQCPIVVGDGNHSNAKAALELAESVAKAETERETNLNTRGTAVATVAGIIVPIATALAKPVFTTSDSWPVATRRVAEYVFLAALVSVTSAMVMAVVGVLRPTRGGQTKNAVGEAVVNVWCQKRGDIALAAAGDTKIAVFLLDHLLRAIPPWHYRNRLKARWLRRAWMFLTLGIILIGSVGVIFLTELSKITWEEAVVVIAVALVVIWFLIWLDFVFAGRGGQRRRAAQEKEQKDADKEAAKIVALLDPVAVAWLRELRERRDAGRLRPEEYEFLRTKIFDPS